MVFIKRMFMFFSIFSIMALFGCSSKTEEITTSQTPDKALTSMEYVELGGVKQCLLIRSHNTDNPILLFVHGGPGTTEMPLIRYFNSELEKHFTVVYWEQRGTGKSYSKSVFSGDLSINNFIEDGYELSKYLLKRFKKEKLFLAGHSWGSIISAKLAISHSELYYAYVGIGQDVYPLKGEQLSFQYSLSKAIESNNRKAIRELEEINIPNYLTIENNPKWYEQLKIERKWLTYFGGVIYGQKDYNQYTRIYLKTSEYSLFDMVKFALGSVSSLKCLWPEIMKINLLNGYTDFKIPVYFIQGQYDYNCPTELVKEYYEKITAPKKEILIFEKSAHNPNFEENKKFNDWIIEEFKNLIVIYP